MRLLKVSGHFVASGLHTECLSRKKGLFSSSVVISPMMDSSSRAEERLYSQPRKEKKKKKQPQLAPRLVARIPPWRNLPPERMGRTACSGVRRRQGRREGAWLGLGPPGSYLVIYLFGGFTPDFLTEFKTSLLGLIFSLALK